MLEAIIGGAIGKAIGKIADWIPNKKERYRDKIDWLKRKLDDIQKEKPTVNSVHKYELFSKQLREYEEKLKNLE